ncbi:envelope stress response membrane protein PspB [Sphingomonas montana]|uniref:envelope stress response membrane protein PspB n=1 Tax=Sphingomonas montana TaxID=1843236 RepID=UPI00096F8430|nr:envelope stress response membrane protein PspB [Sphingomonas montana]
MEDILLPIIVVGMLFIGLPWLIFHYITRWKQSGTLTVQDENLMDDLYETARRLDDRLATIERIIAADHPDYRLASQSAPDRDYAPRDYRGDPRDPREPVGPRRA